MVFTEEAEQELGGIYRKLHTIIVRPKNTVETKPDIVLDLLKHEAFGKAMEEMGIDDLRANTLGRESGYSPIGLPSGRIRGLDRHDPRLWDADFA
jgi:hypothetical protein